MPGLTDESVERIRTHPTTTRRYDQPDEGDRLTLSVGVRGGRPCRQARGPAGWRRRSGLSRLAGRPQLLEQSRHLGLVLFGAAVVSRSGHDLSALTHTHTHTHTSLAFRLLPLRRTLTRQALSFSSQLWRRTRCSTVAGCLPWRCTWCVRVCVRREDGGQPKPSTHGTLLTLRMSNP